MTTETKHLWKWWAEWLCRLLRTTWHLINRKAYRRWKKKTTNSQLVDSFFDDFFNCDEQQY